MVVAQQAASYISGWRRPASEGGGGFTLIELLVVEQIVRDSGTAGCYGETLNSVSSRLHRSEATAVWNVRSAVMRGAFSALARARYAAS